MKNSQKHFLFFALAIVMVMLPPVAIVLFRDETWLLLYAVCIPAAFVFGRLAGKYLALDFGEAIDRGIKSGVDKWFSSDKPQAAFDAAWKSVFGDLKAPAPKVVEPTIEDREPIQKPELVASREWVDGILNSKLANVMRVDGEAHRQILQDAPAYYIYTAETKDGTRIGRLFKGRGMGLALTHPIVFGERNQPSMPDTDSLAEYQQWHSEAESKYDMECIHTSSEDWGKNPKHTEIPQDKAITILSWSMANGHIRIE